MTLQKQELDTLAPYDNFLFGLKAILVPHHICLEENSLNKEFRAKQMRILSAVYF
jgi:hypothetical protein